MVMVRHTAAPNTAARAIPIFRLALLAITAIRLWVAAHAPLSADEAYYCVWSRALAGGYLDHPPMVALWIRAGTSVAGDTALGVRLLGPVSALLGSLMLMRAAADFWPGQARRAGLVAACLFNATLVANAGAVVMTPDTPLLFFWTAALACLARLLRTGQAVWWLAFGVASGLALDSKYTACLLGAAALGWLASVPAARIWWGRWQLWAGGAISAGLFAPVLAWNAANGWVSFLKQGGRTGEWQPWRSAQFLAELLVGQIGLATPLIAVLLAAGVWRLLGRGLRSQPGPALLAWTTLLPAAIFCLHAVGDRVQANWPAVIYPGAVLATCASARYWRAASAIGAVCAAAVFLQAASPVLVLPRAADFTLIRLAGWSDLAGQVFAAQLASGTRLVAADEYGLASELAWHMHGQVVGVEPRWAYFALPHPSLAGQAVLLVRSAREQGGPDPRFWADIRLVGHGRRARAGELAEAYDFYSVRWTPHTAAPPPPPPRLPIVPAPTIAPAPAARPPPRGGPPRPRCCRSCRLRPS